MVYKLKLAYSAGLSADISNILSGEVNAALKLKFFFFSKTYKQRLLKFNGFCTDGSQQFPCHIPILELGGSATLADFPWAAVRPSQLLPRIEYLPFAPEPDPMSPPPDSQKVDLKQIDKLFYDRECLCVAPGMTCNSTGDCCEDQPCSSDSNGNKICGCRAVHTTCATNGDCCSGLRCEEGKCEVPVCRPEGATCAQDNPCCDPIGLECKQGICTQRSPI
jgi:hypothetical protein